ncbi:MAG: class I SAM-dependent methyltransferase [Candidatus Binatia bacterium]
MNNDQQARKAQTKTLFNMLSSDYDSGAGCFAHFGRRLVEVAGINSDARVLDIASGRGAVLFPAAERAGAGGEVVGVDMADMMAQATNEEAARRGLSSRVSVMDAEELIFPDKVFDFVTCGFGIMFFPDQDRGLAEMRRVLKPGGCLALSTWRLAQGADLQPVLKEMGIVGQREPGWITEPDILETLIQRNGFTNINVQMDSMAFRYRDAEDVWQTARGTGMRRVLDRLDAMQKERALALYTERMKPYQRPDGYYLRATALLAVANR